MKRMKVAGLGALAALGLGLAGAPNAEAAYIEYLYQSSNNVVQSAWASAVSWVSPQATCQAP
jgi:hypothetical protein